MIVDERAHTPTHRGAVPVDQVLTYPSCRSRSARETVMTIRAHPHVYADVTGSDFSIANTAQIIHVDALGTLGLSRSTR